MACEIIFFLRTVVACERQWMNGPSAHLQSYATPRRAALDEASRPRDHERRIRSKRLSPPFPAPGRRRVPDIVLSHALVPPGGNAKDHKKKH
jgi:hypothetical protein